MPDPDQPVLIYDRIDANKRRTLLLLALFGLTLLPFIACLLPVLLFYVPLTWLAVYKIGVWGFLVVVPTLVLATVTVFICLGYLHANRLILRITGAQPVRQDEAPELRRIVENLCIGAGLPQPRLYVAESATPNAFAIGLNPSRASIIVTRGLLQLLDRRELEGVVAHELSHIANYDTRVSTVAAALAYTLRLPRAALFRLNSFIGIVMLVISYFGLAAFCMGLLLPVALALIGTSEMMARFRGLLVPWLLELFVGGSPGYVYILAPKIGRRLQGLVSQEREFLADADAALLTRYPEGLARALAKLSAVHMPPLKAESATAHLYIVEPSAATPWWDQAVQTHPPIEERISVLARMGSGIPASVLKAAEQAGTKYRYSEPDTVDAGAWPSGS
jgi:heat shock protein HtpX